jgi:hypothetical protein
VHATCKRDQRDYRQQKDNDRVEASHTVMPKRSFAFTLVRPV